MQQRKTTHHTTSTMTTTTTTHSHSNSLAARHEQYLLTLHDHLDTIDQLHRQATQELLPQLTHSLGLTPASADLTTRYLNDKINLFRFLIRNRFDIPLTLLALSHSIQWRLESGLDLLSPTSLEPTYFENPLLFLHSDLKDKWGRNSAVLNLRHLVRTPDGSLDGLKEFIAWVWELARKSIYESNPDFIDLICSSSNPQSSSSSSFPSASNIPISLQVTLIVDLKGASMSNLELELLPYLLHLVKDNFPDMVGAIFILNYGWMYAGMWQIVKRILTPATLDRIFFLSQSELLQFFDRSNLLLDHGGSVDHPHGALQNPFMNRFGEPASGILSEAHELKPFSRHPSIESIHDIFFSAANTPHHQPSYPGTPHLSSNFNSSHRKHSGLNMTTYHPSHISSKSISEGLSKARAFPAEWSQAGLTGSNFQLKFPIRTQDEKHEEITQDPSAALLVSDHLSGFSSSSSLSETGRQLLLSTHQDDEEDDNPAVSRLKTPKRRPTVEYQKRKRDYFCLRLIIKFGYVFRALHMLFRILTHKVLHSRQETITTPSHDHNNRDKRRQLEHNNNNSNPHHHHHLLHLHHLFLILNLQRKKMISSFGCLLFFLIFFKKKKN